jgi:hypothetical protein
VTAIYISGTALLLIVGVALLLRRKGRTVVDNCVIWVSQDTHCTAIVHYRDGRQIIRFGAEVGVPPDGGTFLYVDVPDTMYTDDGHIVPEEKAIVVKQRLSHSLKQLGIAHEFAWPETADQSQLR